MVEVLEPTIQNTFVDITVDALLLFAACRESLASSDGKGNPLFRTASRRTVQEERSRLIKSGNVFIYNETTSGIRRWTDGLSWSPSRIVGNFLIYRQLDSETETNTRGTNKRERSSTLSMHRRRDSKSRNSWSAPMNTDDFIPEADSSTPYYNYRRAMNRKSISGPYSRQFNASRRLIGSLTDTYNFKKDGLIKKTISMTINNCFCHMVSYYKPEDVINGYLITPSSNYLFENIAITDEIVSGLTYRIPPQLELMQRDSVGLIDYNQELMSEETTTDARRSRNDSLCAQLQSACKLSSSCSNIKRSKRSKSAACRFDVSDYLWMQSTGAPEEKQYLENEQFQFPSRKFDIKPTDSDCAPDVISPGSLFEADIGNEQISSVSSGYLWMSKMDESSNFDQSSQSSPYKPQDSSQRQLSSQAQIPYDLNSRSSISSASYTYPENTYGSYCWEPNVPYSTSISSPSLGYLALTPRASNTCSLFAPVFPSGQSSNKFYPIQDPKPEELGENSNVDQKSNSLISTGLEEDEALASDTFQNFRVTDSRSPSYNWKNNNLPSQYTSNQASWAMPRLADLPIS